MSRSAPGGGWITGFPRRARKSQPERRGGASSRSLHLGVKRSTQASSDGKRRALRASLLSIRSGTHTPNEEVEILEMADEA
jgi:hypothetical protein